MSTREERRRRPGAVSRLRCHQCQTRFAIAGPHRRRSETPAIELVTCPACQAMERTALPLDVGIPFRVIGPGERMRRG